MRPRVRGSARLLRARRSDRRTWHAGERSARRTPSGPVRRTRPCWRARPATAFRSPSACVLGDYAAATGFDPGKAETDQGTDMPQAADYRRKTAHRRDGPQRHLARRLLGARARQPAAPLSGKLPVPALPASDCVCSLGGRAEARAASTLGRGAEFAVKAGTMSRSVGRRASRLGVVVTWGAIQVMTEAFVQNV